MELYLYTTPLEADVELALDDGRVIPGVPCVANGRDDAHKLTLPADVTSQGAVLRVTCSGYGPFENRGILNPSRPCFELDDVRLTPVDTSTPEPEPGPDPNADPAAIIQAVYDLGDFNLATKAGCGLFTEACCTALHDQHSAMWGHIKKVEGQNQFNAHAVDAVMLMTQAGSTPPGGYDIIHNSVSVDASPAFNYAGVADGTLWYYPAAPL